MTTAWGRILPEEESVTGRDLGFYVFAVGLGTVAGWVDIKVGDLLFTALLVLAPCMLLGMMRPARPWRWVIVVGAMVPLAVLSAYLFLAQKPSRAQVYESFLAFLPGIAGAFGGALLHHAIRNITGEK